MSDLILSRYTKIFQENGTWWLFHSTSGTVAHLTEDFLSSDEFLSIQKNKRIADTSDNPVVQQMRKFGILVSEDNLNKEVDDVISHINNHIHNPDTLELIILPTEKCNFRCVYCYEDFMKGAMKPDVINGIKKYISTSLDAQTEKLAIEWFGGEPLAAKHVILDLSEYFIEIAKKHDITYQASMTTNGYLLDSDTFSLLYELGIKSYQITIDGPPEIHNKRRPLRSGLETFQRVWENLTALQKTDKDFSVILRTNVDNDNYDRMKEWFSWLANTSIGNDKRFRIHPHLVWSTDSWQKQVIIAYGRVC